MQQMLVSPCNHRLRDCATSLKCWTFPLGQNCFCHDGAISLLSNSGSVVQQSGTGFCSSWARCSAEEGPSTSAAAAEEQPPQQPSFVPFVGSGNRLDGKAPSPSKPAAQPPASGGATARLTWRTCPFIEHWNSMLGGPQHGCLSQGSWEHLPSAAITNKSWQPAGAQSGAANGTAAGAAASSRQKAGKVVFGGGNRLAAKQASQKDPKVQIMLSCFCMEG